MLPTSPPEGTHICQTHKVFELREMTNLKQLGAPSVPLIIIERHIILLNLKQTTYNRQRRPSLLYKDPTNDENTATFSKIRHSH